MAKRTFTPVFSESLDGLIQDVDRASEAIDKRLGKNTVPSHKPTPIVNGIALPQKIVLTGPKKGRRDD